MELVGLYRKFAALSVISTRRPWFVGVALRLLTSITFIVICVVAAAQNEILNPFAVFSDMFDGDARQAALARGFTCRDTSGYCTHYDLDGIFSSVFIRMSGNRANEISFRLRENTLTVGDLASLWGKPEIRLYCETVVASWPTRHIMSIVAPSRTGRISYFLPVISVSFTHNGPPNWGRLLMNDVLHNCGQHPS